MSRDTFIYAFICSAFREYASRYCTPFNLSLIDRRVCTFGIDRRCSMLWDKILQNLFPFVSKAWLEQWTKSTGMLRIVIKVADFWQANSLVKHLLSCARLCLVGNTLLNRSRSTVYARFLCRYARFPCYSRFSFPLNFFPFVLSCVSKC